jgi:hypothetical protein
MRGKRNRSNNFIFLTMNLTEEHLKQLDAFIQEMPTKFGLPLIQFFNKIKEESEKDNG